MAEYVVPILTVAATAYSAYSSYQSGQEAKSAKKKEAARLAESYKVREEQERERGRRLLATQRARMGASGIEYEGSPLLVQMESAAQLEKDLLNIRRGAQWDISETLFEGEQYARAGTRRAGTTILTGAADIGESIRRYGWMTG